MTTSFEKEYDKKIDGATAPTTSEWFPVWMFEDSSFHIIGTGDQTIVRIWGSNEYNPSKANAAQLGQDIIKDDIVVPLESCRQMMVELVQNPDGNPITVIFGGRV